MSTRRHTHGNPYLRKKTSTEYLANWRGGLRQTFVQYDAGNNNHGYWLQHVWSCLQHLKPTASL